MKKGQVPNALIGGFITILVAVIVFVVFTGIVTPMHSPTAIANETHENLGVGTLYTLDQIPVNAITSIRNATDESQVMTTPDDYNITLATGVVNMSVNGNYSHYYTYEESTYLQDGTERQVFSYFGLLIVVAIIVFLALMIRT